MSPPKKPNPEHCREVYDAVGAALILNELSLRDALTTALVACADFANDTKTCDLPTFLRVAQAAFEQSQKRFLS